MPIAFVAAAPLMAHSATFDLNFGAFSDPSFGTSSDDLVMYYEDVATGINATLTAANEFPARNASNHGAAADDIRVNMRRGNSVELTLTLWDATIGSGYDSAFNVDGGNFDWNLVFYDLDGVVGNSTDNITLLSPATYTVTTTTALTITETEEGYVQFVGGGAANVPGQTGLDSFTQEQADVAVSVNIDGLSSISFIYEATGTNSGRNVLIDGGTLTTSLESFNTVTETVMSPAAVPLPASALLMLGGLTALYGARHLSRKRA